MIKDKSNNYKIMYIIDDQSSQKEKIKKEFIEILTKNNGKIIEEKDCIRTFAYKINHKKTGHYFTLKLNTRSENIENFNRVFLLKQKQGEVVRRLVVNIDTDKINTFKEKKESVKKPEFNKNPNRESKVKNLDYSNNRNHQNSLVENKKPKVENSSEPVKTNPEEK